MKNFSEATKVVVSFCNGERMEIDISRFSNDAKNQLNEILLGEDRVIRIGTVFLMKNNINCVELFGNDS